MPNLTDSQIAEITEFVDVAAEPCLPTAHVIFGTNQVLPVDIVAGRYHRGLAPLVIATGGVNRYDHSIEGRVTAQRLVDRGVPEAVVRIEDRSTNTWENVEFAVPYLHEALDRRLGITAVCKWYLRRAVHALATLAPGDPGITAITFDPIYQGRSITRETWPGHPHGYQRVMGEWEVIPRLVERGQCHDVRRVGGVWRRR